MMYLLQALLILALVATPLVLTAPSKERDAAENDYWEMFKFKCYLSRLDDARRNYLYDTWESRLHVEERIYEEIYGCPERS